MSMRYPGGLINGSPVTAAYPSGVWTPSQTNVYNSQNVWQYDQYWRNTTLLLHGDGTNGAQNNTFLDSSSNNFSITRNGNTTQGAFTPYQQNGYWSNYFDGNGDYLTVANNTALDMGTGDFTIEMWVFSTLASTDTQYRRFLATGTNATSAIQIGHIGATTGVVSYTADDTAGTTVTGTTNILNQWAHVAVVRASGTVKLYVNGVSEGTPITDSNSKTTSSFTLGKYPGASGHLNGWLSNVRIVKGTAVYASNFTPSTSPLTAITNTQLLTCQSNRFLDNSTNAFAITRNGDTSVQAFQPFPGATTWSASVLGGSGYFDGSGDYLSIAASANQDFGSSDFTVEFWWKPDDEGRQWFYHATTDYWFGIDYNSDGGRKMGLWASSNGTSWNLINADPGGNGISSGVPQTLAWNHVAVSRSGGTWSMWLNGTRVLNLTGITSGIVSRSSEAKIVGAWANGSQYLVKGYMNDFRVVIGSTIYSVSSTTITVPTAPLTAVTNTKVLLNFTNAGIFDNAQMNDLETAGNAQVSTSVVKYGTGAMYFDGNGDYLQTYNTKLLSFNGTSTFTVEGWFYQTANVSASGYMNNVIGDLTPTAATALYWSIGMNASNQPGVRWYDGSVKTADASTALALNQWNHVAWVVTAGVVRIFINGVQATLTGTTTLTTPSSTVGYLIIGADRGYYMTGYMDDLRVSQGVTRYVTSFTPPIARMPNQ